MHESASQYKHVPYLVAMELHCVFTMRFVVMGLERVRRGDGYQVVKLARIFTLRIASDIKNKSFR